jgi:hypothetical protein
VVKIHLDNCCCNRPFDNQKDNLDYTEWRRDNLWPGMSVKEILAKAAEYERAHPRPKLPVEHQALKNIESD